MKIAMAVMVKTPGISPVKTRLAATFGRDKALPIYEALLHKVSTTMHAFSGRVHCVWAVAEASGLSDARWSEFAKVSQGEGGLGDRLHTVYQALRNEADAVILVGADCPDMEAWVIEEAINALQQNQWVIGPSLDGGFYLFAGKELLPRAFWQGLTYSTSDTLSQLESALPGAPPYHLPCLRDIDTESDFLEVSPRHPALFAKIASST